MYSPDGIPSESNLVMATAESVCSFCSDNPFPNPAHFSIDAGIAKERARNDAGASFVMTKALDEAKARALGNSRMTTFVTHPKARFRMEQEQQHVASNENIYRTDTDTKSQRFDVPTVLRSYSCSSSSAFRNASFQSPVPRTLRRLSLASIAVARTNRACVPWNSILRTAVLPNRRQAMRHNSVITASVRHREGIRRSVAKNALVEILVQRGIAGTKEGGRLAEKLLCHNRRLGVGKKKIVDWGSGLDSSVGKISKGADVYESVDIERIVFRQLNVLKRGGYWEHLPRDDDDNREHTQREGDQQQQQQESGTSEGRHRTKDNKENLLP